MNEISKQVCETLNPLLNMDLTDEEVCKHINRHMLEPRVVLNNMLRDLVQMAGTVKKLSVVRDKETDTQVVDTKAMGAYLKTIDQITAIYKMEIMRTPAK